MRIVIALLAVLSASPAMRYFDTASYASTPQPPRILSGIAFRGVHATDGAECDVYFKDVVVGRSILDVTANLDKVDVILSQDEKSYTTLAITNLNEAWHGAIGSADHVSVVVRNKDELKAWSAYFQKAKARRESWRKEHLSPQRVLPPEQLSP